VIFGSDRNELRQMYVDAWRKYCASEPMSPLESQIAQVIEDHPEYQPAMTEETLDESYAPEGGKTNPFRADRDQQAAGNHAGFRIATNEDRGPPHGRAPGARLPR
jgi:hypothetical protein